MKKVDGKEEMVTIEAPDFQTADFEIIGTAPLVILKFSQKQKDKIRATQEQGSSSKSRKNREARDFNADYKNAFHIAEEGWYGFPAIAIKSAMVAACRAVGYKMTHAKLGFWVEHEGIDTTDGTALIKIFGGEPKQVEHSVRNATGVVDIRVRAMWTIWRAKIRVKFDRGMFSLTDIANLLLRAGAQCGIGEGRQNSRQSVGQGWGSFTLVEGGDNGDK
jgi:hypothetical protein